MSRLTRDGTAEPVLQEQILRRVRGQGNIRFSCSADHEQVWQPYPVDPYSVVCGDHTHTYILPRVSKLTWDGTAEPVSREQILRRVRGQGVIHFPCSADHEQDWQPYPVDPCSAIYVMTIHTYILPKVHRHGVSKPRGSSKRVLP